MNTTGDTHPMHIHRSNFQPMGASAGQVVFADDAGDNLYDPATRRTSAPLVPGRYVYHCHVLEHEDTQMMRPFVVTVMSMADGDGGGMHM